MKLSFVLTVLLATRQCQAESSWFGRFFTKNEADHDSNNLVDEATSRKKLVRRGALTSSDDEKFNNYYPSHYVERRVGMKKKSSSSSSSNSGSGSSSSSGKMSKKSSSSSSSSVHPGVTTQSDCDQFNPNSNSGGKSGKMSSGKMSSSSSHSSSWGGKMYGGKMYGGRMYGGKMYGGKMSSRRLFSKKKAYLGKGSNGNFEEEEDFGSQNVQKHKKAMKKKSSHSRSSSRLTTDEVDEDGVLCDENVPTKSPSQFVTQGDTPSPTETFNLNGNTPTKSPTLSPTEVAFIQDGNTPTPTRSPSSNPTHSPTTQPSRAPSGNPTDSPTSEPSVSPSVTPTVPPSPGPTNSQCVAKVHIECQSYDLSCEQLVARTDRENCIRPVTFKYTVTNEGSQSLTAISVIREMTGRPTEDIMLDLPTNPLPMGQTTSITEQVDFDLCQGVDVTAVLHVDGKPDDGAECENSFTKRVLINPPTRSPTESPSGSPSTVPSTSPTQGPTFAPSDLPSSSPTASPSSKPSSTPSHGPTVSPSATPTNSRCVAKAHVSCETSSGGSCDELAARYETEASCSEMVTFTYTVGNEGSHSLSVYSLIREFSGAIPKEFVGDLSIRQLSKGQNTQVTEQFELDLCSGVDVTATIFVDGRPDDGPECENSYSKRVVVEALTKAPTLSPTTPPTYFPTARPSFSPSESPAASPSSTPSTKPTVTENIVIDPPTQGPTLSPTRSPSESPSSFPTSFPTSTPTRDPTVPPTNKPTQQPDDITQNENPSTDAPSPSPNDGCVQAFVHCSGISTCFLDDKFNGGENVMDPSDEYKAYGGEWSVEEADRKRKENAWGWSIFLGMDICELTCQIYTGATDCDTDLGESVGTAKITNEEIRLDLDGYTSNTVQVYAGCCTGNDGGGHLLPEDSFVCLDTNVAEFAASTSHYPLRISDGPFQTSLILNEYTTGEQDPWPTGYSVFPLASQNRQYLSIAMSVCPVAPTSSPTEVAFVQQDDTKSPTSQPSSMPTENPSLRPTSAPSSLPTSSPTDMPTPAPSSPPTSSPTDLPSDLPSQYPSVKPTSSPTVHPTNAPSEVSACQSAYVYCADMSTCFLSNDFNEGMPVTDPTGWGWSIFLGNQIGDLECFIYTGVTGCDVVPDQQIGIATITPEKIELSLEGYESNSVQVYAGCCSGNDAANHLDSTDGYVCQKSAVSEFADSTSDYPLRISNGSFKSYFELNEDTVGETDPWPTGYSIFPLASQNRQYLTIALTVCPGSPTASPTELSFIQQDDTGSPTSSPTYPPTALPSDVPHTSPTETPSLVPSGSPTVSPSLRPSNKPSDSPTITPTKATESPSDIPTREPTPSPTFLPTSSPVVTSEPTSLTKYPTEQPSAPPSNAPTGSPTLGPTGSPVVTLNPTSSTESPTPVPTLTPSQFPTSSPTGSPSDAPTGSPTLGPTGSPVVTLNPTSSTESPTPVPTLTPSQFPTPSPTGSPSNAPTDFPTLGPTGSPVITSNPTSSTQSPTGAPTSSPSNTEFVTDDTTNPPTMSPTGQPSQSITSCSPAYVYCPCSSTCFLDPNFNQGVLPGSDNDANTSCSAWGRTDENDWGWNVELASSLPMECEIWSNAIGCSRHEGTMVGTVQITHTSISFSLHNGYASSSYTIYGGLCEGSDNGKHRTTGYCDPVDVAAWATTPSSYTYSSSSTGYTSTFQFDESNAVDLFPIDLAMTKYISSFVEVCPTASVASSTPTASPTGNIEQLGGGGPSMPPSSITSCSANPVCDALGLEGECCPSTDELGNHVYLDCCDPPPLCTDNPACAAEGLVEECCPTKDNVWLDCCFEGLGPTSEPTNSPTDSPTQNPTTTPTGSPSSNPTSSPTVFPTNEPTSKPSTPPTSISFITDNTTPSPTADSCMDAWVWCPDRSLCFKNETFNAGTPGDDWGWSIDVEDIASTSGCTDCQIWANSDCGRDTGVMVGRASIHRHFATVSLGTDYVASAVSMYGGKCEGSDGGDAIMNQCGCKSDLVAAYANDQTSFPIQEHFPDSPKGYLFNHDDSSIADWGGDYSVFPLGGYHRKYASIYLRVCPSSV